MHTDPERQEIWQHGRCLCLLLFNELSTPIVAQFCLMVSKTSIVLWVLQVPVVVSLFSRSTLHRHIEKYHHLPDHKIVAHICEEFKASRSVRYQQVKEERSTAVRAFSLPAQVIRTISISRNSAASSA